MAGSLFFENALAIFHNKFESTPVKEIELQNPDLQAGRQRFREAESRALTETVSCFALA